MKGNKFFKRLLSWALGVSVRVKIMGIACGLVLLLGLAVILQSRWTMRSTLGLELEKRGVSIARDVATKAVDLVLLDNSFSLRKLVKDTLKNNKDVHYIFILDRSGNVLAHTFGHLLPPDLQAANSGDDYPGGFRTQLLESEEGIIHDIVVPIFEGKGGVVRVGMSEERLKGILPRTTKRLFLLIVAVSILGVIAAYLLTFILTKPLLELKEAAKAVGCGDFRPRARVRFGDEISQLSATFNAMADNLEASRNDLLQRNEELTTLNLIAATVSQSLDHQKVLEDALDKVLETMRLGHGEILLFDAQSGRIVPRIYRGLSSQFALEIQAFSVGDGIPGMAVKLGKPIIIEDNLAADRRFLRRFLVEREGLRSMISVPLRSKSRVVGVLDLFSTGPVSLPEEKLRLLAAIGDQIGVAVENAQLLEDLKTKEKMRVQLLEKIISTQEDERKRVARELHDETSQSLASLMLSLKVLESSTSVEEVREKIAGLRTVINEILSNVHDLAFQLRPSLLDGLGLAAAVQRLAEDYAKKFGLSIDCQLIGFGEKRLPSSTETALYRIVQEALTNVAKHAKAKNAGVILRHEGTSILAIIEDDGKGFPATQALDSAVKDKRLGLFGMKERAALVGGKMTIESAPGKGTTVFAEVPL